MIKSFKDQGTEDIHHGRNTKAAHKVSRQQVWVAIRRKLDTLDQAKDLRDLRGAGMSLEALTFLKPGYHSIRASDKYRIVFRWEAPDAYEVEVADYH